MTHYGHQGPFGGPPCHCSCHNTGGECDSFKSPCCDQPGESVLHSSASAAQKPHLLPLDEDPFDDGWRN